MRRKVAQNVDQCDYVRLMISKNVTCIALRATVDIFIRPELTKIGQV